MSQTFQKMDEDFVCDHCGASVKGSGYTNHCPVCLWSKHVDKYPGDRAETCWGMMKPIKVEMEKGEFIIYHQCVVCECIKRNKSAKDDNLSAVL